MRYNYSKKSDRERINEMDKRIKIEPIGIGKAKLSIDDKEFELDKKELRNLLYEAENAMDILGCLEVKQWENIVRE